MTTTNGTIEGRDLAAVTLAVNAAFNRATLRGSLASKYFDSRRNVWTAVSYPETIDFAMYQARYQRGDIAERLVNAKPDETWRKHPRVLDGADKKTARDDTEFVKAWDKISDFASLERDLLSDSRSFWYYFRQADRMMNLGGWSALVLGMGNGDLASPLPQGNAGELAYLSVYDLEGVDIQDADVEKDPFNPRFGLPTFYQVRITDSDTRRVHFSRVIHCCETDDLTGTPILQSVYNRLIDVEKVMAASGEAGWRMANRKIVISTKDGYKIGEDTVPAEAVASLLHDLKDVVGLDGVEVTVLDGQIVDPSPLVDKNIDFIAGTKSIPKRILLGSERGELASSQDETNWLNHIDERRKNLAEPVILRPFLYRLIYAGVLPMPSSGRIFVDWPSLYEMDDNEKADIATKKVNVIKTLAEPNIERVAHPVDVLRYLLPDLPEEAIPNEAELLAMEAEAMAQAEQMAQQMGQQPGNSQLDNNNQEQLPNG